jgi:hypothetical protein
MYNPYNKKTCKDCPFAGKVFETNVGVSSIKYVDCQRDNKDAQKHFIKTNKNESLLLWVNQTKFLHCLYADDGSKKG